MAVKKGTAHNDKINGTSAADSIFGFAGIDTLSGGVGNDTIDGGKGGDFLSGSAGRDVLKGSDGDDVLGGAGRASFIGGSFQVRAAKTTLQGLGNDTLMGGNGNDVFIGDPGADRINGGKGTDVVFYLFSPVGVNIELGFAGHNGFAQGDVVTGVEFLAGSLLNDTVGGSGTVSIFGSDGDDIVFGRDGAQTLDGGEGHDFLQGLGGADRLSGGAGNDNFEYFSVSDSGLTSNNSDVITDFSQVQGDKIDLFFIDAEILQGGDQQFIFTGTVGSTLDIGYIEFQKFNNQTHVFLSIGGDGTTNFVSEIIIQGLFDLTINDFVL